ncbi:MAG TPA: hypothetical protein VLA12_17230, partial [Planctomycetaceae bacterium]|nr:hypothetical protein [Planctomycetaceae bacterium]
MIESTEVLHTDSVIAVESMGQLNSMWEKGQVPREHLNSPREITSHLETITFFNGLLNIPVSPGPEFKYNSELDLSKPPS